MAVAGLDPALASERMGHRDGGALFLRTYRHLYEGEKRTQATRVVCEPIVHWKRTGTLTNWTVQGFVTIGHEAAHLRSVRPERTAECLGVRFAYAYMQRNGVFDSYRRSSVQTAHRWWYYLLRDAGLVEKDVMSGMHMHRARHTFAVEFRRDARDLGVVQHMLGHSDPNTTERYYGHYDLTDSSRRWSSSRRSGSDS